MALSPPSAATCRGVRPFLPLAFTLEPLASSRAVMSERRLCTATCRGVQPFLPFASRSAPFARSSSTISLRPPDAAQCNGS